LTALKRMGVLAHPLRSQTAPVAEEIAGTLQARGIDTWVYSDWEEQDVTPDVETSDMVIAIGGDGAMLRAARVCAPHGVPVLGVNMGKLGFLTEITRPNGWEKVLRQILDGDYWIEERMMIRASVVQAGQSVIAGDALNDVVITSGVLGGMLQLETYIDDDWATTYNADALIIATATGSTAYALALGGPILPPELRNILIVPAAAHLSMDRPIVLSEGATVDVLPISEAKRGIALTVDGVLLCQLGEDDRVRVQASEHSSRFVRLRTRNYFYRSLLDRLEPRILRPRPQTRKLSGEPGAD